MSAPDFQSLLARLGATSTSAAPNPTDSQNHVHHQNPSVSSPINDAPQPGPQPRHPEDIISPNNSALHTPVNNNSMQNTSLLSLLRGGPSSSSPLSQGQTQNQSQPQSRPVSAAELVAGFGRNPSASSATMASPPSIAPPAQTSGLPEARGESVHSPTASQDFLLRLLNSQTVESSSPRNSSLSASGHEILQPSSSIAKENQPLGSQPGPGVRPFSFASTQSPPAQNTTNLAHRPSPGVFTATNPFDQFSTSSTPKQPSNAEATKQPETVVVAQETETVSEAVGEVGEQAEKQIQQVLAQLEKDVKASAPVAEEDVEVPGSWEDVPSVDGNAKASIQFTIVSPKPFVTTTLRHLIEPPPTIPPEVTLHCVRIKKDFDQVDRNLVAATSRYIWYALKDQGFKVIDHETAKVQHLFANARERIFNISVGLSKPSSDIVDPKPSALLATGVNGTIFWAPFTKFDLGHPDANGFMMPPLDLAEDPNSNSQLKTRVKTSSRHPDFFAYGRGKWIYFIRPFVAASAEYTNQKTEVLDYQKYFAKETFKISVGKAAKDFAFSPDDTVLASIDKIGKLKFWDVSFMVNREDANINDSFKVKSSMLTIHTSSSENEKAWPTTVMFFDKEKQMTAGLAARYVLVGTKQNHNIQFWDLCLGQKVAELNLPHEDESDGICSISFNPKASLLVIGHPTRNSIYMVSISPPKYGLPGMTQAKFISLLVARDSSLPNVEATVCIASFREYSLNNIGELRSLDIAVDALEDKTSIPREKDYVMTLIVYHAKGIFEFTVNREQLGLTRDNKPLLTPITAEPGVQITLAPIVQPRQGPLPEEIISNGASPKVEESSKSASDSNIAGATPGAEKKKDKKKKAAVTETNTKLELFPDAHSSPRAAPVASKSLRTDLSSQKSHTAAHDFENTSDQKLGMESRIISALDHMIQEQFGHMQHRVTEDFKAIEHRGSAKESELRQAVLQAVEKNFNGMVTKSVSEKLENLKEGISNGFDRSANSAFGNAIKNALPREMEKVASLVSSKLVQDSNFVKTLSTNIAKDVNTSIGRDFQRFGQNLGPIIETAVGVASASSISKVENHLTEQLAAHEARRQQDMATINSLNQHVNNLTTAIRDLVQQQAQFKADVMAQFQIMQAKPQTIAPVHKSPEHAPQPIPIPAPTTSGASMRKLMDEGKTEEAIVQWLHAQDQAKLFDEVFANYNPQKLQPCSPLVILSVTAACTITMDTNIEKRLQWLDTAQSLIQIHDPEIAPVLPKVLDTIFARLDGAYHNLMRENGDPGVLGQFMQAIADRNRGLRSQAVSLAGMPAQQ